VTPRFPSGVGRGAMWARLESPRANYATPGLRIGTTRALRRRQLPTKRCHAALLFGATRAYQPDSSSKPPHRQPRAGVLGNLSTLPRAMLGRRQRPRHRGRRYNPLDSWSFHISLYTDAIGWIKRAPAGDRCREPSLSAADSRDTVTSVRRLSVSIFVGLLILAGALLPGPAEAHLGRATVSAAPPGTLLDLIPAAPTVLRAQPGVVQIPWLLVGLGGGLLLALTRPRRALVVLLIVLLGVLAVENGVHSVHHLGERQVAPCVVAAAASHLTLAIDGGTPVLHAPVSMSRPVTERSASHRFGPSLGPDPARAPPALIA
jgi:hypothetical protein